MSFPALLDNLQRRGELEGGEIDAAFAALMDGQTTLEETTRFLKLTAPMMDKPQWLAAGARAMRARMLAVKAPTDAIDVCGTGGDGAHTLNISTAVAFVAAGCGVPVAKHGNRAMSSKSGAADVLEALGVRLTGEPPVLERCLGEAGVAFLFAQNHHPAMRHVAQARRALGHRTIFNLLGPLSNPASVTRQLVGVFAPDFVRPLAEALRQLGAKSALVVHGAGGLDEFSTEGAAHICLAAPQRLEAGEISASALGFAPRPASALRGGDAIENAAALRALLSGAMKASAYEDAVLLNAAAALYVARDFALPLAAHLDEARESLASGAARNALEALIAITQDTQ